MGNIVRFVLIFCCYIISNACWYRVGREHGATDVLRRLAGVIIPISKNEYSKLKAENAKLRKLCGDMMWTIRHAHGYFKNDTHEMLMTYVRGRDGKPTHIAHSLTCDEEEYERRMTELRIEVD